MPHRDAAEINLRVNLNPNEYDRTTYAVAIEA